MSRPDTLPTWATDTNYPAGSDPWSGMPTKRAPSAGEIAVGATPGEGWPAQYLNYQFGLIGEWIEALDGMLAGYFGDGSDGDCAFDGTNTFSFASKSGNDYTLTRDVYFASATFSGSATLRTNGWRIFCRGAIDTTATALSGDVIHNSGGNASGTTPGAVAGQHTAGGGGGSGGNGAGGQDVDNSYGGDGGDATGTGASTGGVATQPTADGATWRLFDPKTFGSVFVPGSGVADGHHELIIGGAGGGSNSGTGTAGGGAGGVLAIAAHTINLLQAADLRAKGGDGSIDGAKTGGGGGGGVLLVMCVSLSHALTGAVNCPAGTGGTGAGAGQALVTTLSSAEGVASSTPLVSQSGKEIITATDTVNVTFLAGFAYATATGLNGYRFRAMVPYCSDGGDPLHPTVTAKSTTGFTVTFNRVFTGELDWETEGTV